MAEEKDDPSPEAMKKIMDAPSVAEGLDRLDRKAAGQGSDQPSAEQEDRSPDAHDPPQPVLELKPPSLGDQGEAIDPEAAKSLSTTPPEYKSRTETLSKKYSGDLSRTFSRTNGQKM